MIKCKPLTASHYHDRINIGHISEQKNSSAITLKIANKDTTTGAANGKSETRRDPCFKIRETGPVRDRTKIFRDPRF